MSLDNSTIQHPLPGDLQSRVENALNLVTSLEAEEDRLRRMAGALKGEINALHAQKKELEAQIQSAETNYAQLSSDITDLNVEFTKVQGAVFDAKAMETEAISNKEHTLAIIEDAKKAQADRESELQARDNDLMDRSVALSVKEAAHQKKVERLLEALK